jgi:DNA-binding NarL/FixJ family response regulator
VLHGVAGILRAQPDIDVVATCSAGREVAAAIQQFNPDVAVLDISMPDLDGLGVLSSLVGAGFETKAVFLTAFVTDSQIMAAIALGARGIMLKDAAPNSLIDCVRDISQGKQWFPADLVEPAQEREGNCPVGALSPRERQIALLVSDGLSNKHLARELDLTEGTVKVHLHNIYEKLDLRNRTELTALAIAHRERLNRDAAPRRAAMDPRPVPSRPLARAA